eukprot:g8453.t1
MEDDDSWAWHEGKHAFVFVGDADSVAAELEAECFWDGRYWVWKDDHEEHEDEPVPPRAKGTDADTAIYAASSTSCSPAGSSPAPDTFERNDLLEGAAAPAAAAGGAAAGAGAAGAGGGCSSASKAGPPMPISLNANFQPMTLGAGEDEGHQGSDAAAGLLQNQDQQSTSEEERFTFFSSRTGLEGGTSASILLAGEGEEKEQEQRSNNSSALQETQRTHDLAPGCNKQPAGYGAEKEAFRAVAPLDYLRRHRGFVHWMKTKASSTGSCKKSSEHRSLTSAFVAELFRTHPQLRGYYYEAGAVHRVEPVPVEPERGLAFFKDIVHALVGFELWLLDLSGGVDEEEDGGAAPGGRSEESKNSYSKSGSCSSALEELKKLAPAGSDDRVLAMLLQKWGLMMSAAAVEKINSYGKILKNAPTQQESDLRTWENFREYFRRTGLGAISVIEKECDVAGSEGNVARYLDNWQYFCAILLPFVRGERNLDNVTTPRPSASGPNKCTTTRSPLLTNNNLAASSTFDFSVSAFFLLCACFCSQRHQLAPRGTRNDPGVVEEERYLDRILAEPKNSANRRAAGADHAHAGKGKNANTSLGLNSVENALLPTSRRFLQSSFVAPLRLDFRTVDWILRKIPRDPIYRKRVGKLWNTMWNGTSDVKDRNDGGVLDSDRSGEMNKNTFATSFEPLSTSEEQFAALGGLTLSRGPPPQHPGKEGIMLGNNSRRRSGTTTTTGAGFIEVSLFPHTYAGILTNGQLRGRKRGNVLDLGGKAAVQDGWLGRWLDPDLEL